MKTLPAALLLALAACSTGEPATEKPSVGLNAAEQSADPTLAARKLIDQPEADANLDHAAALVEWHLEKQPGRADLHVLAAEAHSRACEQLDKSSGDHARHRAAGFKHGEQAVKLAPDDGAAYYWLATNQLHLADAEQSLGRAKAALKNLDKADELAPKVDEGGPSRMRGKVLVDMPALFGGSVSKGIESFKKSLGLAPECITTHLWLGQAYAGAGKADLAKKEFEWVLAAKPRPGHEKEDAKSKKDAEDALRKLK